VLMVAAGLLVRGYFHSQRINPGFQAHKKVLLIELAPPELYGLNQAQTLVLFNQFAEGIRGIPGVRQVSFARRPQLTQNEMGETKAVDVPGHQPGPDQKLPKVRYNVVAPGYFETMGTRLVEGRTFDFRDSKGAPDAVIINETMARQFWTGESAVGRWFRSGKTSYQVIGVAEDGKYLTLHETPQPYLYLNFLREFSSEVIFLAEVDPGAQPVANAIFQVARRLRAEIPVTEIKTLGQHVDSSLSEERASAQLFAVLGGVAVLLAAIGLCSVISFLVNSRLREFSVRMALGATPREIDTLRPVAGVGDCARRQPVSRREVVWDRPMGYRCLRGERCRNHPHNRSGVIYSRPPSDPN
jgi:putative ABC transport system permease protein